MNNLTKTLLGGVALSVLAAVPAVAQVQIPAMRVTALHAGHVVKKTNLHNPCSAPHCDYTFSVYSYQPASAPKKTHLIYTYYKWNSNSTLCSDPKEKIKAPKKSIYAKIGTATETYSLGCPSGPTVFYGDTWSNKTGVAGETDYFVSTLTGKFQNNGIKYKGVLPINVYVVIE